MSKTPDKPKRMGRPPKAKAQKQSEAVQVLLTPSERRQLAKDAKAAGHSLGGHLRELWLSERQLPLTAWHEAGHAVVGYRHGFYGGPVTIVPDMAEGTLGSATGEGRPDDGGEMDEAYIVGRVAGAAAERLYDPRSSGAGSWSDDEQASTLLARLPKGTERRLRAEAKRLVGANRKQIEAVATALLEDKTLSEDEWVSIVDSVDEGTDWRRDLAMMRGMRCLAQEKQAEGRA
jgi:hypothetical protein